MTVIDFLPHSAGNQKVPTCHLTATFKLRGTLAWGRLMRNRRKIKTV